MARQRNLVCHKGLSIVTVLHFSVRPRVEPEASFEHNGMALK